MTDTFPHDTSGGAASAITVRDRSGSTVGPSGSHYIIGPLQKASGPKKKKKPRCLIFGTRTIRLCIVWSGLGRALVGATWCVYGCYFRACWACLVFKGVFRACFNVSQPHALLKGACCTTLLEPANGENLSHTCAVTLCQ